MDRIDLKISPVQGAVGIVMVGLAFTLWILRPLDRQRYPARRAKLQAGVFLIRC